jgi:hypothetical protein
MDTMLVAFWLCSGAVIVANIIIRVWQPERSSQRSHALFPPILSSEPTDAGNAEGRDIGYFEGEPEAEANAAAGGD